MKINLWWAVKLHDRPEPLSDANFVLIKTSSDVELLKDSTTGGIAGAIRFRLHKAHPIADKESCEFARQ